MITTLIIWIIGWMFSVGLCFDATGGKDGFIVALLMLLYWPLILGCMVRENIGRSGK